MNWLGNVPIGAFESINSATVLLDKKLHLQGICRHDGVVIGREGFLDDGRHSLEANAVGGLFDLSSNGQETAGVVHFVSPASHSGVIISPAEDAKEVGAGNHQATQRSQHSRQFADEVFRLVHVFQDVEGADGVKMSVGKGKALAVVKRATAGPPIGFSNVWFRDVHALSVQPAISQLLDDLADAAANVENSSLVFARRQRIDILPIKRRIPIGQKRGVIFVPPITFNMAHGWDGRASFWQCGSFLARIRCRFRI